MRKSRDPITSLKEKIVQAGLVTAEELKVGASLDKCSSKYFLDKCLLNDCAAGTKFDQ